MNQTVEQPLLILLLILLYKMAYGIYILIKIKLFLMIYLKMQLIKMLHYIIFLDSVTKKKLIIDIDMKVG